MSIEFAEKLIDEMVDENGHCGERGLSQKQFDCIARYLDVEESEWVNAWYGDKYGGRIDFYSTNYTGTIGKYTVVLNELYHFNRRCTVVEINPLPAEEIAAEKERREAERRLREMRRFDHSEWVGAEKERMDMELTLVRESGYEREAYTYGTEWVYVHTLRDADGNCIVWKTINPLGMWVPDSNGETDSWVDAEVGDKVTMKATVKEHGEYRGVKQTVITRPKVKQVVKG